MITIFGAKKKTLVKAMMQDVARLVVLNGSREINKEFDFLKKKIKELEKANADLREEMKEWTRSYK